MFLKPKKLSENYGNNIWQMVWQNNMLTGLKWKTREIHYDLHYHFLRHFLLYLCTKLEYVSLKFDKRRSQAIFLEQKVVTRYVERWSFIHVYVFPCCFHRLIKVHVGPENDIYVVLNPYQFYILFLFM